MLKGVLGAMTGGGVKSLIPMLVEGIGGQEQDLIAFMESQKKDDENITIIGGIAETKKGKMIAFSICRVKGDQIVEQIPITIDGKTQEVFPAKKVLINTLQNNL